MDCIASTLRRGRYRFTAVVLATMGALVVPGQSHASCCACTGAAVAAGTKTTLAAIKTSEVSVIARIQVAETQITQAVGSAAEKIHYTIRDQTRAQQEMINGAVNRLVSQTERLSSFQARQAINRAYGDALESTCVDANASYAAAVGERDRQSGDTERDELLDGWMRSPEKLSQKVLGGSELEPQDIDVEALLMDSASSTERTEDRERLVQRLVDFTPPEPLPEDQNATPKGTVYRAALNERRMRLEPSISVLRERASKADPLYPSEGWLAPLMEQTGYGATREGRDVAADIESNDGQVSYDLRQKLQVRARSMNSLGYQQRIAALSGDALTREMIKQMAISNQLAYDRLRLSQRMALIDASESARDIDETTQARLNRLRIQSVPDPSNGDD